MLKDLSYGIPQWLAQALDVPWEKDNVPTLDKMPGFDHVRTYKSRVVISQPYQADGELGDTLSKLHNKGVRIRVSGVSPYYSGRTFSLILWRTEDDDVAKEIVTLMEQSRPDDPVANSHNQWT